MIVLQLLLVLGIAVVLSRFCYTKDDRGRFQVKPVAIGMSFVLWIVSIIFIFGTMGTIGPGNRGVVVRMGSVTDRILDEGLYFVLPFVDDVEVMTVQIQKEQDKAAASSKDLQSVATEVTLNYRLEANRVNSIYQDLRKDYIPRIIDPSIQESVKAVTAKYTAEELITKRAEVRQAIAAALGERVSPHGIQVVEVAITDFAFSATFNQSIEAKVEAEQNALKAENVLEQVKFEAQQEIERGKAEAEKLRLQKQEITPALIRLREVENQTRWIEKWNGVMPTFMMDSDGAGPVPLVQLPTGGR